MNQLELVNKAYEAQRYAYTPYSHWQVGAALLAKSGKVYTGCNIENAAYTPTNCAERTAFFKAISEGEREFEAIAIVGNKEGQVPDAKKGEGAYCAPCGVCRQVMEEFCQPEEFKVILGKNAGEYKEYTLAELLPEGFGPGNLK